MTSSIGFIGLGAMGFGMATQLISSGYTVHGYDVYTPLVDKFVARGGVAATSPKEVASASKVLLLMVATAQQVREVLFTGPNAAINGLAAGSIIVLCSTVSPQDVIEFRHAIPEQFRFVDCPVSGGTERAANGTLTILASGSQDDIALARPVLEAMAGKDTLHIIPSKNDLGGEIHEIGNGMKAKTVHQTLAGIHIALTAESIGLAAALGLDIRKVVAYISSPSSLASSWMFENRSTHLLSGDRSIHSALNIIVKDMGIVTSVGRKQGVPLFLSSAAEQVLNRGVTEKYGLEDDSRLYRVYLPKRTDPVELQIFPSTSAESAIDPTSNFQLIEKLLRSVHLAATAEALNFGAQLGLGGWNLYPIVAGAAGTSTMFVKTAPAMLDRNFSIGQKGEATISILEAIKDLSDVVAEASKMKFPLPLGATALQMFQSLAARGMGEESVAAIIKLCE